MYVVFVEM